MPSIHHLAVIFCAAGMVASCQAERTPETAAAAFGEREGALVMLDCGSGQAMRLHPETAAKRFPPCSTFKIWNTLIGLRSGDLTTATAPFYQWDGQKRSIPEWNRDLNLREAFQCSCVPAFQDLARKIGAEKMQAAIHQIDHYEAHPTNTRRNPACVLRH